MLAEKVRYAHTSFNLSKSIEDSMEDATSGAAGMRRKPQQARSKRKVNRILDVAERMFVEEGYNSATTNVIAKRAKVSIGSLYQFFPDKSAILQALTTRYRELLQQRISALNCEALDWTLSAYAKALVSVTKQFFDEHPGYHAVFMSAQGAVPEIETIEEATDALLVEDLAAFLKTYRPGLSDARYTVIAFILVKTIGTLIWLSLEQAPNFQQNLVAETEQLVLSYLSNHFED